MQTEHKVRPQKMKVKRKSDSWELYLMILPAVLLVLVFIYAPMGGLLMAFQEYRPHLGLLNSPWVGLDQFRFLFEYPDSVQIIWNTLKISSLKLVLGIGSSLLFALFINEMKNKFLRTSVQTFVFLPHFISWVVLGGIFTQMLNPDSGLINMFLNKLGYESIFFLGSNDWFVPVLLSTEVWKEFGYGSIVFLAALAGINPALYEAAEIDGATKMKQVFHITLPSLLPIVCVMGTLSLSSILGGGFDQIFNLYNPLVYETGDIIDTFVYRVGLIGGNFSFGTAIGLFKSVVGLILILIGYRLAYKIAGYKIF